MNSKFFPRYALVILCIVFFLLPFALRGSRMALQHMKNDVKDWLPSTFQETMILDWFGQHFVNERFVVITWPKCSTDDDRFDLMVSKLAGEVARPNEEDFVPTAEEAEGNPELQRQREDYKARLMGDRLGFFYTGDYHENWAGQREKWFKGDGDSWYYLLPDGSLYRWAAGTSFLAGLMVRVDQLRGIPLQGTLVAQLRDDATLGNDAAPPASLPSAQASREESSAEGDSSGENRFYRDPRRFMARMFTTVVTGPQVLEQLTAPEGPLWPYGDIAESEKPRIARAKAMARLSGNLFGPAHHEDFSWTPDEFLLRVPAEKINELPTDWQSIFTTFVEQLVDSRYGGDRHRLLRADFFARQQHWDDLWNRFQVAPPAQQTCIVLTLSEPAKRDMRRVMGRPMLGRPRGQLLALAEDCNISTGDFGELKLGGPPVDNIAIDEEGSITLVRLVGFCVALGLGLSFACFRSIPVTIMVFLVGGISAVTSMSIVYWTGWTADAVLMSMPSLVYVLGISGAVHIVNYYRDACEEHGLEGATSRALAMGWGPCTLAAFTTSLGLGSLFASNLMPIKKFGLFSAVGVMATLILLFTYLPSALELWPPGYHKKRKSSSSDDSSEPRGSILSEFWVHFGRWVVRRHQWVTAACLLAMIGFGYGITQINTSVQLLKLFDQDAKIIRDYRWLEDNLGELVPMEIVVRVTPDLLRPTTAALKQREAVDPADRFKLSFLDRVEITRRVQQAVENEFGPDGREIVGRGMSAATFAPDPPPPEAPSLRNRTRNILNVKLEESYDELVDTDYLRIDTEPEHWGSELWRISLRVGALSDVDYGEFVHELKHAVEPVMAAYNARQQILTAIDRQRRENGREEGGFAQARIAVLGHADPLRPAELDAVSPVSLSPEAQAQGDTKNRALHQQSQLFTSTLAELLINAGFDGRYAVDWVNPDEFQLTPEDLQSDLEVYDCVVVTRDHDQYEIPFLREHSKAFVDARNHRHTDERQPTAADLGEPVHAIYTGVVPVVYKAQRTLLTSLMESIGWAFVLIMAVMMVLLRTGPLGPTNLINFRGGMVSMIPNVFPVVIIFGAMGHMRILVDIGSMMTASVAMGVAVDDTIHFLTWFRSGIRQGMDRLQAIELAYRRCASAMTITTLVGGLGLSVFMLSTFTPTQRFGTLMLTLLVAALVGDLLFLPALLAGPLGRYFSPKQPKEAGPRATPETSVGDTTMDDSEKTQARPKSSTPPGQSGTQPLDKSTGATSAVPPHHQNLRGADGHDRPLRTDPSHERRKTGG